MARKNYDQIGSKYWGFGSGYDFTNKTRNRLTYKASLYNKTIRMFTYDGLPETIKETDLERIGQINGFGCVINPKYTGGKVYATWCALGGDLDHMGFPKTVIVNNPHLKCSKQELTIGTDCVLFRSDSFILGLDDINTRYASLFVELDITLRKRVIDCRVPTLVSCQDNKTEQRARQYFSDIEAGKAGILTETAFIEGLKTNPYSVQPFIKDLIEYQQYLKASWLNEMGVNANYNMKREALNSAESALNEDSLSLSINDMLECRETFVEELNKMLGTNVTVRYNSAWYLSELERKANEKFLKDAIEGKEDPNQSEGEKEVNDNETGSDPNKKADNN